MDVVVTGRHLQVSEDVRDYVLEKVSVLEKFRDRIQRVEVQFTPQHSKQNDAGVSCEITLLSKGPAVRAVGQAEDKQIAFDGALDKLKTQLRKAADRRKQHKSLRTTGLAEAFITEFPLPAENADKPETQKLAGDVEVQGDGPLVLREKEFAGTPLTLAQALDEMELVGHDFFLYVDAETRRPSVVYRRKGYNFGVIHLNVA